MSPLLARVAVLGLVVAQLAGCSRTLEPGVTVQGNLVSITRPADGPIITDASDSTVAEVFELYDAQFGNGASQQIVHVVRRSGSTYLVVPAQQLTYDEYELLGPLGYIVDLNSGTITGAPRD
ncbi:MAG: hypothetical protein R3C18_11340 [Planctomycetaceae bacterium]